jgi:hypothetical protein
MKPLSPQPMGWRLILLNVKIKRRSYGIKKIGTAFCRWFCHLRSMQC